MTPRISIVTTVFDRVACLRRCLRSVQRCLFTDWEQIVVADHPPTEVVSELKQVVADLHDPRVQFVNRQTRANDWGISPARDGLRLSTGQYVCFLSDDNAYLPDHFGPLVASLDANPNLGFVYSSCQFNGRRTLNAAPPRYCQIDLGQPLFRRQVFRDYFQDDIPFHIHAWDGAVIDSMVGQGVQWRHHNAPSFVFNVEKYPRLMRELA